MMDAIVQLVRNFMCCIKDLNALSTSIPSLYDPSVTARFYTFPSPLDKTTPLEFLISLSQLYAAVSCTRSGLQLIFNDGLRKLVRLNRVADICSKHNKEKSDNDKNEDKDNDKMKEAAANTKCLKIIFASLMEESESSLTSTLVGLCVLPIGISFFWLFANSLHITEAGWIGGLPALIHALTIMEVALVPLLYYMIKDGKKGIEKEKRLLGLVDYLEGKKCKDLENEDWVSLESFELWLNKGWKPFWVSPAASKFDVMAEEKMLLKEMEIVKKTVQNATEPENIIMTKEDVEVVKVAGRTSRLEGYREYIYFLFNFIAFYGYLLGIVVYYFDDEEKQPDYVKSLKFGYNNGDADWGGNFAGDLMWTLEPVVILASPLVLQRLAQGSSGKVKSD